MIECWTCDGFGYLDDFDNGTPDEDGWPCPECHGAGEIEDEDELVVIQHEPNAIVPAQGPVEPEGPGARRKP